MQLNDLYGLAARQGIKVHSAKCPNSAAMCLNTDYGTFIGLDSHIFKNESRERLVLAHELAHHLTNAYYDRHDNDINVKRMEFRATKKQIELLIPFDELDAFLFEDCTVWDVAEHFDVPPELVKTAMWVYYKREVQ